MVEIPFRKLDLAALQELPTDATAAFLRRTQQFNLARTALSANTSTQMVPHKKICWGFQTPLGHGRA